MSTLSILAVIPARGGSKGLPGKNIRPLAGLPLIAHSIRCANMVNEITKTIISTDSEEIATVAKQHGGHVPFLRPSELALDHSPMIPVLQHALNESEKCDKTIYDALLLLDPTSPGRLPEDIREAISLLEKHPTADSVVSCSEPTFNPLWVGVQNDHGVLRSMFPEHMHHTRRQDVPPFLRINGSLFLWRTNYLRTVSSDWFKTGTHLGLEMPEKRAFSIDDLYEFELAEALISRKMISVPWLPEKTT